MWLRGGTRRSAPAMAKRQIASHAHRASLPHTAECSASQSRARCASDGVRVHSGVHCKCNTPAAYHSALSRLRTAVRMNVLLVPRIVVYTAAVQYRHARTRARASALISISQVLGTVPSFHPSLISTSSFTIAKSGLKLPHTNDW